MGEGEGRAVGGRGEGGDKRQASRKGVIVASLPHPSYKCVGVLLPKYPFVFLGKMRTRYPPEAA